MCVMGGGSFDCVLTKLIACWVIFHALLSSCEALTEGHSLIKWLTCKNK